MKVIYVASACVVIEHQGTRILCDPWLTDGAFYGSWYHVPRLLVEPEEFHHVDAIYLSHIHQDHAHLDTLKRLKKGTPVYLAPYAERFLAQMLRGRGFPVVVVPHGEQVSVGSLTLEIVAADNCNPQVCGQWIGCPILNPVPGFSYQVDSLAVFTDGKHVVVNLNDCPYPLVRPVLEQIRTRYKRVDLLLTAYSGAGPWPQCFAMDEATMLQEAKKKEGKFIQWAHFAVGDLDAQHWLPFAGQYTLGGKLAGLNRFRGVPELEDLPSHPRMVRLPRNGTWDVDKAQADRRWIRPGFLDFAMRDAYIHDTLAQKPLDYERDDIDEPTPALWEEAITAWYHRLQERQLAFDWTIQVNDWRVHCGEKGEITITCDLRLLTWLLRRKAHWNAAEIGSHLRFEREPNVYERAPYLAMAYLHI